jgi:predicted HicB family RNase H-like nuclease
VGASQTKSLVARLPVSLHRELSTLTKAEGVSLNTLMVSILSRGASKLKPRHHS